MKKRIAAVIADSRYNSSSWLPFTKPLLMPSAYILNDEETIARMEKEALEKKRQEAIRSRERMEEIVREFLEQEERKEAEGNVIQETTWYERLFRKKDR